MKAFAEIDVTDELAVGVEEAENATIFPRLSDFGEEYDSSGRCTVTRGFKEAQEYEIMQLPTIVCSGRSRLPLARF